MLVHQVLRRWAINRESTHTPDRDEALSYLRRRTAEAQRGLHVDPKDRATFAHLRARLEESHRVRQNRSLATAQYYLKHLEKFLGSMRAPEPDLP